jgi:glyoxylase-like metal-dependent hydrolase (beta-lactamase superfamily II)
MGVEVKSISVGSLEVNCYIVYDGDTKEAMVIDPGDEPDRIQEMIQSSGLRVKYIVCTHTHFDHVGAIPELEESTGAAIAIHRDELDIYRAAKDMGRLWGFALDSLPEPDRFLKEGDELHIGKLSFTVLHTPGHSPGCICLYGEGLLFTGDTIFAGSVGRTDFPGGSLNRLKESFKRLLELPENTRVLPGHGPSTTIGTEKEENFFVAEL